MTRGIENFRRTFTVARALLAMTGIGVVLMAAMVAVMAAVARALPQPLRQWRADQQVTR